MPAIVGVAGKGSGVPRKLVTNEYDYKGGRRRHRLNGQGAALIGFSKTFFASGAGSTLIATLKVVLGKINFIIEAVTEAIKLLEEMLGLKTASENASSNKVTGLSFTGGKDLNTTGTKFQPTGEVFSFGSISGQNTIVSRSGSDANPITINVQGADPKAVVDAVSKYAKQNGGLPSSWNAYGTTR